MTQSYKIISHLMSLSYPLSSHWVRPGGLKWHIRVPRDMSFHLSKSPMARVKKWEREGHTHSPSLTHKPSWWNPNRLQTSFSNFLLTPLPYWSKKSWIFRLKWTKTRKMGKPARTTWKCTPSCLRRWLSIASNRSTSCRVQPRPPSPFFDEKCIWDWVLISML